MAGSTSWSDEGVSSLGGEDGITACSALFDLAGAVKAPSMSSWDICSPSKVSPSCAGTGAGNSAFASLGEEDETDDCSVGEFITVVSTVVTGGIVTISSGAYDGTVTVSFRVVVVDDSTTETGEGVSCFAGADETSAGSALSALPSKVSHLFAGTEAGVSA